MKDEKTTGQDVMAYADGELADNPHMRVLHAMAADPSTVMAVIHQRQLRQAVGSSMAEQAPAIPTSLRSRILEAAAEATAYVDIPAGYEADLSHEVDARKSYNNNALSNGSPGQVGPVGAIRRWLPAAVAAVLLIGAFAVMNVVIRQTRAANMTQNLPAAGHVLTVAQIEQFARRHVSCSTMVEQLQEADWPSNVEALPAALAGFLHAQTNPILDLSQAGYEYVGSGPCTLPRTKSAHLIYRPTDSSRRDSLSLWVLADDGSFDFARGELLKATSDKYPHPMLIWRNRGLVYYLMGDSPETVRRASDQFARGF